jgi:hypothetical protein
MCDTSSPVTGSFTTPSVSTTEFVGWVFAKTGGSAYLNLPTGAPIATANFWITALCSWDGPSGIWNFSTNSGSAGAYAFAFPFTQTYYFGSDYNDFTLDTGGNCLSEGYGSGNTWGPYNLGNGEYLLSAGVQGYWNESRVVNSAMSSLNDYQEFVITPNQQGPATLGLALLDDSSSENGATPPVECSFDCNHSPFRTA